MSRVHLLYMFVDVWFKVFPIVVQLLSACCSLVVHVFSTCDSLVVHLLFTSCLLNPCALCVRRCPICVQECWHACGCSRLLGGWRGGAVARSGGRSGGREGEELLRLMGNVVHDGLVCRLLMQLGASGLACGSRVRARPGDLHLEKARPPEHRALVRGPASLANAAWGCRVLAALSARLSRCSAGSGVRWALGSVRVRGGTAIGERRRRATSWARIAVVARKPTHKAGWSPNTS